MLNLTQRGEKVSKKFLILFAASTLLLMACDASSLISQFLPKGLREQLAQEEPTEESTEAPAATPAAPVATRPPSGQPSTGNPFADALSKAKSALKYRVEFAMLFGSTQNGKYSEEAFIDFSGEVDGKNSHFVSKGGIFALLSGGGNAPLEIIEADGKTYMKGISLFGTTDPKVWYIQKDTSSTGGFQEFTKPDYYNGFTGTGKTSDFRKVRSESVDGQSCDVYLYDLKSVQNAAIVGLLGSSQTKNEFAAIDKAESNVWLCGDGFVHKYTLEYAGHDQKNPNDKGAMKINAHTWDFNNAALKVTAPQGAKPMPGQ